jgi:hypothetical protein
MKQNLYYFVFRDENNGIIAIRAYLDGTEADARYQAQRDSYKLDAHKITRAIGDERCMVFG